MEKGKFKLIAKGSDKSVMLKWGTVQGADGYRVYMVEGENVNGIRNLTEKSVKITGLENGELYTIMIKAYKTKRGQNGATESGTEDANTYLCETPRVSCAVLGEPSGLTAESRPGAVALSWKTTENAEFYRVYVSQGAALQNAQSQDKFIALTYTGKDNCVLNETHGLKIGAEYKFKVCAGVYGEHNEFYGGFSNIAGGSLGEGRPEIVEGFERADSADSTAKVVFAGDIACFDSGGVKTNITASVNGIKVAVVSFRFDGATAVLNPGEITAVREEGAEFVVAVCRWGVANSHMVRDNQRTIAERLVEFGADCIIGTGVNVVQEKSVITTDDGKSVPVFYSLGDFADNAEDLPANRDAVLLELTFAKNDDGSGTDSVEVSDVKMIPCSVPCEHGVVPAAAGGDTYNRIKRVISEGELTRTETVGDFGTVSASGADLPKKEVFAVNLYENGEDAESLIGKALKAKESGKITALIKHRFNPFYTVERQVRLLGETAATSYQAALKRSVAVNRDEESFCERVNPDVIIDISKNYFSGGDKFFDEHIERILRSLSEGKDAEDVLYGDIWLRRYLHYYESLTARKFTSFIGDRSKAADLIAEKSSKDFLYEYFDETVRLKNAGMSIGELLDGDVSGYPEEFIQGVRSIKAMTESDFVGDYDYSVMFNRKFGILEEISGTVGEKLTELFGKAGSPPLLVTPQTLEFYFKLLRYSLRANKQELGAAKEAFDEYTSSASPVEIDVWGTDISYLSAKLCNRTAVGNYLSRNPVCWAFTEPIPHDEKMFASVAAFMSDEARRSSVVNNFKRNARNIIERSKSRWIIVDFFDLTGEMALYKDGVFAVDEFIKRTAFWNNIKKDCKIFRLYRNYNRESIRKELDKMAELLKSKYNGNIILNRVTPAELFIGIDGEVGTIPLVKDKDYLERNAEILRECEDYFIDRAGCYVIDISGYFMSDERYPFGGADIGNYEEMFYKNTAMFMANILRGKDDVKVYDRINPVYRLLKVIGNK